MTALQLLFGALLVLANGFFVGAEFALVSVRRSQIEPLAAEGSARARRVLGAEFALVSVRRSQIEPLAAEGSARARRVLDGLENLPQMMAAAQFGITVCSLTLGAVAEPTIARLLEPFFVAVHLPAALVHPAGYAIALAVVVFFHLVIGEMVPKNLAMAAPERTALWFSPALVAFARLCRPVTAALGAAAALILRLFGVEPRDEIESVFTSEQLNHLLTDSRQAGLLGHAEHERLSDVLELGSRPLTDVLLDRGGLVTVGPGVTPREVEELTVSTGYSRFPICAPDGSFMGFLHVKDVLEQVEQDRAVPQHLWRPMTRLRAELPLDDALGAMRAAATHLAAVVDGAGRVLGLAALEDVLQTLVGEVRDPAHEAAGTPAALAGRVPPPARAPYGERLFGPAGERSSATVSGTGAAYGACEAPPAIADVTGQQEADPGAGPRSPARKAPHRTPA